MGRIRHLLPPGFGAKTRGLKAARARGRQGGRPRKLQPKELKTIRAPLIKDRRNLRAGNSHPIRGADALGSKPVIEQVLLGSGSMRGLQESIAIEDLGGVVNA